MPPVEATSGVSSLVASIKQHKKFRQLASYSVQCLCKVITPPHQGWERNLRDAFDAGALDAISDVLQRHSGDLDVLKASTQCFAAMATNAHYAAALVASGALMGMLESVMKNPDADDGVTETLALLEAIGTHNPEALLSGGGAAAATRVMASAPGRFNIIGACVRTLEKLNKVPGGPAALVECEAVRAIVTLCGTLDATGSEERETLIEAGLRLLDRTARVAEYADYLRGTLNGMSVLSDCLATNRNSERICKVGGRLLSKLAASSVGDLIAKLEAPSTTSAERDFLAGLLANLAIEEENADKIVANGGCPALLRCFYAQSRRTVEAACLAVERLAGNEDRTDALIAAGAISVLVEALRTNVGDAALCAAIIPTLARIAELDPESVDIAGGIDAVLAALRTHAGHAGLVVAAVTFVEALGPVEYDMTRLVALGAIDAVAAGMHAHPGSADVQLAGTRALIYLSYCEATAGAIAAAGGLNFCLTNLDTEGNKDLTLSTLYLVTSLVLLGPTKDALIRAGGVDKLLSAIAAFAADEEMQETAADLLHAIIDEAAVAQMIATFSRATDDALRTKGKPELSKLRAQAQRLVALSVQPDFAELIVRGTGVSAIVRCLESVAAAQGLPEVEPVLAACGDALNGLAIGVEEVDELRSLLGRTGAVRGVITAIKAHPKLVKAVTSGVQFLESFATDASIADSIVEAGAVEACVAALRANATHVDVVTSATNTLLQLATTDKGAIDVAKRGGTRQVIATVHANVGTPGFATAIEQALALLMRVALLAEGADLLNKQGGVDAVIAASEAVAKMYEGAQAESIKAAAAKVLARLLTLEDVARTCDELAELASSARRGRVPAGDAMKPVIIKLSHLAAVAAYAKAILKRGADKHLAEVITALLGKDDADLKAELLPLAFRTLVNLSRDGRKLSPDVNFAPLITAAIDGQFALGECLELIANLAASSEATAAALIGDNRTLPMVIETLKNNLRNPSVARFCFDALSALGGHASTAPIVASSPALRLVSDWLDDNLDDASPESVEAAMRTLGAMAASRAHAPGFIGGAMLELVKSVLSKCCIEVPAAAPAVLAASVRVVSALGASGGAGAHTAINAAGVLRRVLRAAAAHPAGILVVEPTVLELLYMLRDFGGAAEDVRAELLSAGAQELIVAAMNWNGNSAEILSAGAAALGALGAGEEAGRICIAEVRALAAALEQAPEVTEELVAALGAAVQRLGNFVLIDGVVTAGTAADIMSVLSNAIALLAESELASPATLAAGIQSIGRVVERGGAALAGSLQEAVEMVLDVVAMNEADVEIRMAAIHTLGVIANSEAGLRVVVDLGGLDLINNSRRMAASDRRLAAIVESTLERINLALQRNAAALLAAGDPAGARALAALIAACAGDPARLAAVLATFVAMPGGADALFSLLPHYRGNSEVTAAILAALATQWGDAAGGDGDARRVAGLTAGLQAALTAQAALGPHSDLRSKMNALRMAEGALGLLGGLNMRADGAEALIANGGLESLLQLLAANLDDEETVKRVVGIIKGVMTFASPIAGRKMAAGMATLVATLRAWSPVSDIALDCVDIMSFTARTTGAAACGIDKEAIRVVTAVATSEQYLTDAMMKVAITRLEGYLGIRLYEADVSGRAFRQALGAARSALAALGSLQECVTDDGRTYYYDPTTGVTSWEAPPAFAAFKAAITVLRESLARGDDPIPVLEAAELGALITAMQTHGRSPAIAEAIAATLSSLAANDANADVIASMGGIEAIMQVMQMQPDNVAVLTPLLAMLERVSRNDAHKEAITAAGGIDALFGAWRHGTTNEEIALKVLSTIANLAFNSSANIEALMAKGVVANVMTLVKAWPKHARILENAMCALSNLMYGSDDNKRKIGTECGPEIVRVIAALSADVPLFKMAMRALGNLSFCDDNIRPIVESHHATRALVAGMRNNAKDAGVLQLAMDVIGNLASLEEEPPAVDDDGNVINPKASIAELILKEAGCGEVISCLRRFPRAPAMLESGLDALTNIANDREVTEIMVRKQGLIGLVLEIIQGNSEFEPSVVAHALPLLAAITYSRDLVPDVVAANGIQIMLSIMEQHGSNADILLSAQLTLYHMAAQEDARTSLKNQEGLRTILALLEKHSAVKGYVEEVLKTLTRLCADDELSAAIAENGMHVLTSIIEQHADDPELLTAAFRLLGHLAFVESNLRIIVQHNGIVRVMNAITMHPECQPLIVRSIQTLDNIAMANKENAQIVIDEGGKELIETIMSTYSDDDEIQRYCRSALLSMSALENLNKSAEITRRAAANLKKTAKPVAEEKVVDPLAEFRHALSAGKIMKVWTRGVPKAEHVVVSTDWRSIVWQDVLSHKKQGALDLRSVVSVRAGNGDGHKKAFTVSKAADPACTFSIVGERMSLDVEANNPKERQVWVDGLSKLLVVFRTTVRRVSWGRGHRVVLLAA